VHDKLKSEYKRDRSWSVVTGIKLLYYKRNYFLY